MTATEIKAPNLAPPAEAIVLLDVPVHPLTVSELHAFLDARIAAQARALVLHANVHGLNLAYELPWLRALFNRADLVFCDGAGVMLAAKLMGRHIPERITYADWLPRLAEHCAAAGHSLFLLGARPGVAEEAASALRAGLPALHIAGTHDGYFDHTESSCANREVIERINRADPDILLVAFGMPLQERWLDENWGKLTARIGLSAGAALDYASGRVDRGPSLLVDHGFEWIARMLIEPRRLWRRYLVGNPRFALRLLRSQLGRSD